MNVVRTVRLGGASAVPTVVILASLLAVPSAVRSQGPRVSMGERLYAQQCAGCHGADLDGGVGPALRGRALLPQSRSEEHTSELQPLMRVSYAVFCLKKIKNTHLY